LVFLLAVNYLVAQKSLYLDLTQDKIYTASDASRNILGNLKSPVSVTFYISKDLPADYVNQKTQVQDLLGQYSDLGKGKLQIKYEEPGNDDKTVQDLAQKGIPQLQSQVVAKDKMEVKNFFFGAEITSGQGDSMKKEVMPSLPPLESFEYDFVSEIYSVSKDQKEVVAFLGGHGEKEIDSSDLKKSYEVDKVLISTESASKGFYIDDGSSNSQQTSDASKPAAPAEKKFINPKTVIIAGPTGKISAEEIAVLDDFVGKGGKVVVLSEKVNPDLQQGFVTKNIDSNMSDFTKKYGIEINSDLVYDRSNLPITYSKQTYFGMMQMSNDYPFWIKVVKEGFSDNPAFSKIQSLALLWSSSLSVGSNNDYDVKNLITSSSDGEAVSNNINISPDANLPFANAGKKTLAAISTAKSGSGQVIVIGDSDFVSPTFMQPIPDNETFFLNLVDSISSSANLSSIRSKNISARPLKDLSESDKNYWKFFAIGGGAILLCAYGFMRISKRKKLSRA
jgi:ABC-type uncharacterized transport system involved in gliding motility auxiliary subunit